MADAENAYKRVARVESDPKGNIVRFNDIAEIMFGYAAVDMIGQTISVLMPEGVAKKHDEYLTSNVHVCISFFSSFFPFVFSNISFFFFRTSQRAQVTKIMGKYRKVQAKHKNGTIFEVQIRVEAVRI